MKHLIIYLRLTNISSAFQIQQLFDFLSHIDFTKFLEAKFDTFCALQKAFFDVVYKLQIPTKLCLKTIEIQINEITSLLFNNTYILNFQCLPRFFI